MKQEKTKAFVLKNTPFKDGQCILTLFSEDKGLMSIIVKGLGRTPSSFSACTIPFSEGEFVFSEGRSEIARCHSASLIDPHLTLRESYACLQAASEMAMAILSFQCPGAEAKALYLLFSSFLKHLPRYRLRSSTFLCSFLLKLLHMEGLLDLSASSDFHEDIKIVEALVAAASFSALSSIDVSANQKEKIKKHFYEKVR